MRRLKLVPVALVAAASFALAIATVTLALDSGPRACRGGDEPKSPRSGETVRQETSWTPPGTRCVYRAAATGTSRTVEPSPFIFVINLGLGTLLLIVVKTRVVDQMQRRRRS